jgi:hypothetical protein
MAREAFTAAAVSSGRARGQRVRWSTPGTKRCPRCGIVKALTQYHVDRSRANGRTYYCAVCISAAARKDPPAAARARGAAPVHQVVRTLAAPVPGTIAFAVLYGGRGR